RSPAGLEVTAQSGGEALGNVGRAPRAVTVADRRAAQEGRIEANEIEPFTGHRSEQITVAHIDTIFQVIQAGVDSGAANRRRVDVYRNHVPRMPRGKQGTQSRSGSHVEHLRIGAQQAAIELRREKGPGAT